MFRIWAIYLSVRFCAVSYCQDFLSVVINFYGKRWFWICPFSKLACSIDWLNDWLVVMGILMCAVDRLIDWMIGGLKGVKNAVASSSSHIFHSILSRFQVWIRRPWDSWTQFYNRARATNRALREFHHLPTATTHPSPRTVKATPARPSPRIPVVRAKRVRNWCFQRRNWCCWRRRASPCRNAIHWQSRKSGRWRRFAEKSVTRYRLFFHNFFKLNKLEHPRFHHFCARMKTNNSQLIDWLIDRLIDWCSSYWSVDWLIGCFIILIHRCPWP